MVPISLAEFRARFPILTRRVYVNSCSQGALSIDVDQAMRAYLDSWHESGSPWEMWVEQVERLRARFAASIGAGADEIADDDVRPRSVEAERAGNRVDPRRCARHDGDFVGAGAD